MEGTEEQIHETEDKTIEMTYSEQWRENRLEKKIEEHISKTHKENLQTPPIPPTDLCFPETAMCSSFSCLSSCMPLNGMFMLPLVSLF